ncbi:DUF4124 domain-containing protein [Billgrantia pellis]|uniref:DUF4124 domain-containing protein n=1 Tax=Billgrantia pellis TaxID=2606936 RepID=A0A7V7FX75_9GAMM|nr:DUF4124 domain-containing protein [Halomonas pellis]KAA0010407.1 DUF4124 domain-containing protein [Halomonas pellis]
MLRGLMVGLVGVLLADMALATTIYRTTDAQGNVVFTDDPDSGGEPVDLAPLTVVPSRDGRLAPLSPPAGSEVPTNQAPGQPFMPYDTFRIRSPAQLTKLPASQAGNLQVELAIEPSLRPDHRVRLLVDGQVSQSAMHTSAFVLNDLDRGGYELQAELLDGRGEVRHRTPPVSFTVERDD